jgi:hypothetical protein
LLFHLITAVWGSRHRQLFIDVAIPSLLSLNNIPALASKNKVIYFIYSSSEDAILLEKHIIVQNLKKYVEIKFIDSFDCAELEPFDHVHFYHIGAANAKLQKAIAVLIAPDALWSDGTFKRCGVLMNQGKKAITIPFLQVVAESLVPDILENYIDPLDGAVTLDAKKFTDIGLNHLHPLSILAMPASPHGRPSLDYIWPSKSNIQTRYAVRELFAFNPSLVDISFLWYFAGPELSDDLYISSGPDDMAMLSIDPLVKNLNNYLPNHKISSSDIARSLVHPWNVKDQNQTKLFVQKKSTWGVNTINPKNINISADFFMKEIFFRRSIYDLYSLLLKINCSISAEILSVALLNKDFIKLFNSKDKYILFIPENKAYSTHSTNKLISLSSITAKFNSRLRNYIPFKMTIKKYFSELKLISKKISSLTLSEKKNDFLKSIQNISFNKAILLKHNKNILFTFVMGHIALTNKSSKKNQTFFLSGKKLEIDRFLSEKSSKHRIKIVRGPYFLDGTTVYTVENFLIDPPNIQA